MSLLVFTTNFPPEPGGIARFLEEFCEHLPPPVRVITTVPGNADRPTRDPAGASYEVTRVEAEGASSLTRTLKTWRHLTRELIRHRPRVCLIGHGHMTSHAVPFDLFPGTRYGIVVYALEVKALHENTGVRAAIERMMYRDSDFVIAISSFTRTLLVEAGVDADKVHVVHPGVSPHFLTEPDHRDEVRDRWGVSDEFVLGTVARLVERKGHQLVLRALARQSDPSGWRYLIIGDGPEREPLEALADELGIADRVIFIGHIEDDRLPGLYDAMDLFVLPTQPSDDPFDVEGFGIVFLEAGARNTPSIGSPIGGVTDAVADSETGLLVPPTPEAIAGAIDRLRADRALRERMAERARERVEKQFTWDDAANKFATIAGLTPA